ncbi:MAG: SPW repeat protein [Bryobacteraceae bacterium]
MTPDGATNSSKKLTAAKAASTIVLLAGIWFFISPWVYGAYTTGNALNSWVVGAIIFILGCVRVSRPGGMTSLSWLNALLGIGTFFSPWIYGYAANTGRLINSLCVGVIVFVLAICSATFASKATRQISTTPSPGM